ncbi:TPA: hypothetical protein ACGOVD_001702 [Streptococcus suis]
MAKKIWDAYGNLYVKKKPFYKRVWFIILVALYALFAIGLIKNLTNSTSKQSSTEQVSTSSIKYKTYQVKEATISINESWSSKEGDTSNTLYFYPDDVSLVMASWTTFEESITNSVYRSEYLKGLEESGTILPTNEREVDIDGVKGYLYDSTGEIKGNSYKGQILLVDTPTGMFSIVYMSSDSYSDQRSDDFEKILNSIDILGEVHKSTSASIETPASSEATQVISNFNPTDSSEATIESIKTYSDYMKMYEFIVNEYIANFENMVNQFGLGDASMYQSMRDTVSQTVEQQRAQYGPLGDAPIVGKDEIVQFLKEYRDSLQQQINEMSSIFGG